MKVAVLLYGRINKYRDTYESFLRVFNAHDVDIFYSCDAGEETLVSDFKELYKPVAVCNDKIEYSVDFRQFLDEIPDTHIHNMTLHYINKMRVFQLLQSHIKEMNTHYDIIFSTRLDIIYKGTINFSIPEHDTIHVPEGYDFYGLNDQIAYGNLEVMSVYMNIFNNALIILQAGKSFLHPETLNMNNMKYNGIMVERFPLDYYITR